MFLRRPAPAISIADLLPRFELPSFDLDAVFGGANTDDLGNEIPEAAVEAPVEQPVAQPEEPSAQPEQPVEQPVEQPEHNGYGPSTEYTAQLPNGVTYQAQSDDPFGTVGAVAGHEVNVPNAVLDGDPSAVGHTAFPVDGFTGHEPIQGGPTADADPWAGGFQNAHLAFRPTEGDPATPDLAAATTPGAVAPTLGDRIWDAAATVGQGARTALGYVGEALFGGSAHAAEVPKHLRPEVPAPAAAPSLPGTVLTGGPTDDATSCLPRVSVMLSGVGVNHSGQAPLVGIRGSYDFGTGEGKLNTFGGHVFGLGTFPVAPGPTIGSVNTQFDGRASGWALVSKDVATGTSDIVGQLNVGAQISGGIGSYRVGGAVETFLSHRESEMPGAPKDSVGLRVGPNVSAFGVNGMLWTSVEFPANCAGAKAIGVVKDVLDEVTRPAPEQPVATQRELDTLQTSHREASEAAARTGEQQLTQGWTPETILRDAGNYSADAWLKGRNGSYGGYTSYPVPGTNQRCQIPVGTAYRDNPQGLVPFLRQCGVQFPR